MDKSKKRRCKHVFARPNSMIAKCRNDDETEDRRNQRQGRDPHVSHGRGERRQSNAPLDATGYPGDSHRLRKNRNADVATCDNYHRVSSVPGETYRVESQNHGILRALGGQFYTGNVAVVRKIRHRDEIDVDDEAKYADVDSPVDGDNVEEETGEDVGNWGKSEILRLRGERGLRVSKEDEERENPSEYSDQDYEEQEADDEVDEESDAPDRRQVVRPTTQTKSRAEPPPPPPPRGHRNHVEPSLHRRGPKIGTGKDLERCCHTAERNDVEVPTEDDRDLSESTPCPVKKSTWRYRLSHHDQERRNQPRYPSLEKTSSGRRTRRPRTTRPEVESSMTSTRVPHTRCRHCGVLSGQTPKATLSRNANWRLQDGRYFTRVPIGDEGEEFKDADPIFSYRTKPRRPNETRSQNYDPREEARKMDAKLGAIYKSCRPKNLRESSNDLGERARHSVRVSNRREPLENDHRYWL